MIGWALLVAAVAVSGCAPTAAPKQNIGEMIANAKTASDYEAIADYGFTAHAWLLAQIRRYFSGSSLLYIAGSQSDGNEKRARTNGAHYYVSKPLSLELFGHVLQSFLQAPQLKG